MTVVAVKKEKNYIQIACDSEVSYWRSWNKVSESFTSQVKDFSKIFCINDMYFWCAWNVEDMLVLKQRAKTNLPKSSRIDDIEDYFLNLYKYFKERNSSWNREFQCLMVFELKIFYVYNYCIYEVSEYESIGSGMHYSRAAMYLWNSAAESVDVAKIFATGCWWDTISYSIK